MIVDDYAKMGGEFCFINSYINTCFLNE